MSLLSHIPKQYKTKIELSMLKYDAIRVYWKVDIKVHAFMVSTPDGGERFVSVYLLLKQQLILRVCKKFIIRGLIKKY
jgi:hypothetical protein